MMPVILSPFFKLCLKKFLCLKSMAVKDKRIVTTLQPLGYLIVFLGAVLPFCFGVAFADGTALVYFFLFIIVLLCCRLLGRKNLSLLEIEAEFPRRVYAGKAFEISTYLDNKKKWLNSYLVQVSLKLIHDVRIEARANWIANEQGAKLANRISISLRGSTTELHGSFSSCFPMGLFRHEVSFLFPCTMIVYPRLITPLELMTVGSLKEADPQRGVQIGNAKGEFRGIRAWKPGDSVKRIHWPASARSFARGQGLRVREFDPPGFSPKNCIVIFHSHAVKGTIYRKDRFERAISLAAGTLSYLYSRQIEAQFTADFLGWQTLDCKNRNQYIELLAILAQSERALGNELIELQNSLQQFSTTFDQLVIVSDIDPDAWSDSLNLPHNALVIDIRQIRFKRKSFSPAP
jgi:uncharacterized protein (DUF58 family)